MICSTCRARADFDASGYVHAAQQEAAAFAIERCRITAPGRTNLDELLGELKGPFALIFGETVIDRIAAMTRDRGLYRAPQVRCGVAHGP